MDPPTLSMPMPTTHPNFDGRSEHDREKDRLRDITVTVRRERSKLGNYIRNQVRDRFAAEDILQDVFEEFVEAYRLPTPIEQASAWLYHVARHRIIDRFRKKREEPLEDIVNHFDDDDASDTRLDLALPSPGDGPEAAYARSVLLEALQQAIDDLPSTQREVFVAHEIEGASFKELTERSGVPLNTLLARKRYAVLFLRGRLQAVYDDLEI